MIQGNNVIGFLDDTPVFCGKDVVFNESKDLVETTGTEGKWTYNALQRRGWSVDISGLTKIDSSDGELDYFSIITNPFSFDFHTLTIIFDDGQGNNISITGNVFCSKSSISGNVDQFAEASLTLIGTGEYELSTDAGSSDGSDSCVPVSSGPFAPSDGTLNTAYSYTLHLNGTNPKTLGTISGKPAWMTISVSTGNLVLGGTPTNFGDVGTFFLDIVINNDCGSIHLIDEVGATISEDGRNVFVINNSTHDITLQNANGHSYTFLASNGSDGNIKMQTSTVNITSIGGGATVNYQFLSSLSGGGVVINSGSTSGGNIITSNLSTTNYLRFS